MTDRHSHNPRCLLIAGPNGAGKTTFARRFLVDDARITNFVNADLIAAGLSPFHPEKAAVHAARVMLGEIARLTSAREDFAFESTLSGLNHAKRLERMRLHGYDIEMIFLRLKSPQLALRRVAARVRHGGHNVPKEDVRRRFARGLANFETVYKPLAHSWAVYDNSGPAPLLIESGP